ncbi:Pre-rRNA-processing protein ipi1 [Golovinomyces cichoracearum]|uniref:Pre-rRNA-processing protein IPI1 n=1 Tax=Golovinomyces cichoracearum TaxID=62708 RepID=A0A420J694_9PEZI|nr:Pre-rRNA-processing protein ipi1 [Golovinomyces cichoracearum]
MSLYSQNTAIVVNKQSLRISAPTHSSQFTHYFSVASNSKNDSQRRDALSFLISHVSSLPANNQLPLPTSVLLPKLLPLILDGSGSVRTQLLKLFRLFPKNDIAERIENSLLYIRAGMTHLSLDIRKDALAFLEWLLEVAEEEVVGCAGGWFKVLKCFMSIMGWAATTETSKWTFAIKATFPKAGKAYPYQLLVFSKFLKAGLIESEHVTRLAELRRSERLNQSISIFPVVDSHFNMIPTVSNAYAHLNLFGKPRDEEGEAYCDRKARQRVFNNYFLLDIQTGVKTARKDGGEIGRAAAALDEVLRKGMIDYIDSE